MKQSFKEFKEAKLKYEFGDMYNRMREVIIAEADLDGKAQSMISYLDSDSRHEPSSESKKTWDAILETGELPCAVLITTSVLDNGFSIKDADVKNIVICTDDKTEFLQELGRRRIMKDGEIVNLYIRKLSKKDNGTRKQRFEKYNDLFIRAYGSLDSEQNYLSGNVRDAVARLWKSQYDYRRGAVRMIKVGDDQFRPEINQMARWRTINLKKQIINYDKLDEEKGDIAAYLYKAAWIGLSEEKVLKMLEVSKYAVQNNVSEIAAQLLLYLDKEIERKRLLVKGSDEFTIFSSELQARYYAAFPEDRDAKPRSDRKTWAHVAINNHLRNGYMLGIIKKKYELIEVSDEKTETGFKLIAKEAEDLE